MSTRRQTLDRDAILELTMEKFWESGYEATSVTDLIGHLGLHGTTLYRLFGSKHELYVEALRRYRSNRLKELVAPLRSDDVRPAVLQLLTEWAAMVSDRRQRGCLMVNAAVERIPGDTFVEAEIAAFWDGVEDELYDAFTRARASGDIAWNKSPDALARFIVAVMQGMSVTGKMCGDASVPQEIASSTIGVLG